MTEEKESEFMKSQWCRICKGATCLPGMHASEPTILGQQRSLEIALKAAYAEGMRDAAGLVTSPAFGSAYLVIHRAIRDKE